IFDVQRGRITDKSQVYVQIQVSPESPAYQHFRPDQWYLEQSPLGSAKLLYDPDAKLGLLFDRYKNLSLAEKQIIGDQIIFTREGLQALHNELSKAADSAKEKILSGFISRNINAKVLDKLFDDKEENKPIKQFLLERINSTFNLNLQNLNELKNEKVIGQIYEHFKANNNDFVPAFVKENDRDTLAKLMAFYAYAHSDNLTADSKFVNCAILAVAARELDKKLGMIGYTDAEGKPIDLLNGAIGFERGNNRDAHIANLIAAGLVKDGSKLMVLDLAFRSEGRSKIIHTVDWFINKGFGRAYGAGNANITADTTYASGVNGIPEWYGVANNLMITATPYIMDILTSDKSSPDKKKDAVMFLNALAENSPLQWDAGFMAILDKGVKDPEGFTISADAFRGTFWISYNNKSAAAVTFDNPVAFVTRKGLDNQRIITGRDVSAVLFDQAGVKKTLRGFIEAGLTRLSNIKGEAARKKAVNELLHRLTIEKGDERINQILAGDSSLEAKASEILQHLMDHSTTGPLGFLKRFEKTIFRFSSEHSADGTINAGREEVITRTSSGTYTNLQENIKLNPKGELVKDAKFFAPTLPVQLRPETLEGSVDDKAQEEVTNDLPKHRELSFTLLGNLNLKGGDTNYFVGEYQLSSGRVLFGVDMLNAVTAMGATNIDPTVTVKDGAWYYSPVYGFDRWGSQGDSVVISASKQKDGTVQIEHQAEKAVQVETSLPLIALQKGTLTSGDIVPQGLTGSDYEYITLGLPGVYKLANIEVLGKRIETFLPDTKDLVFASLLSAGNDTFRPYAFGEKSAAFYFDNPAGARLSMVLGLRQSKESNPPTKPIIDETGINLENAAIAMVNISSREVKQEDPIEIEIGGKKFDVIATEFTGDATKLAFGVINFAYNSSSFLGGNLPTYLGFAKPEKQPASKDVDFTDQNTIKALEKFWEFMPGFHIVQGGVGVEEYQVKGVSKDTGFLNINYRLEENKEKVAPDNVLYITAKFNEKESGVSRNGLKTYPIGKGKLDLEKQHRLEWGVKYLASGANAIAFKDGNASRIIDGKLILENRTGNLYFGWNNRDKAHQYYDIFGIGRAKIEKSYVKTDKGADTNDLKADITGIDFDKGNFFSSALLELNGQGIYLPKIAQGAANVVSDPNRIAVDKAALIEDARTEGDITAYKGLHDARVTTGFAFTNPVTTAKAGEASHPFMLDTRLLAMTGNFEIGDQKELKAIIFDAQGNVDTDAISAMARQSKDKLSRFSLFTGDKEYGRKLMQDARNWESANDSIFKKKITTPFIVTGIFLSGGLSWWAGKLGIIDQKTSKQWMDYAMEDIDKYIPNATASDIAKSLALVALTLIPSKLPVPKFLRLTPRMASLTAATVVVAGFGALGGYGDGYSVTQIAKEAGTDLGVLALGLGLFKFPKLTLGAGLTGLAGYFAYNASQQYTSGQIGFGGMMGQATSATLNAGLIGAGAAILFKGYGGLARVAGIAALGLGTLGLSGSVLGAWKDSTYGKIALGVSAGALATAAILSRAGLGSKALSVSTIKLARSAAITAGVISGAGLLLAAHPAVLEKPSAGSVYAGLAITGNIAALAMLARSKFFSPASKIILGGLATATAGLYVYNQTASSKTWSDLRPAGTTIQAIGVTAANLVLLGLISKARIQPVNKVILAGFTTAWLGNTAYNLMGGQDLFDAASVKLSKNYPLMIAIGSSALIMGLSFTKLKNFSHLSALSNPALKLIGSKAGYYSSKAAAVAAKPIIIFPALGAASGALVSYFGSDQAQLSSVLRDAALGALIVGGALGVPLMKAGRMRLSQYAANGISRAGSLAWQQAKTVFNYLPVGFSYLLADSVSYQASAYLLHEINQTADTKVPDWKTNLKMFVLPALAYLSLETQRLLSSKQNSDDLAGLKGRVREAQTRYFIRFAQDAGAFKEVLPVLMDSTSKFLAMVLETPLAITNSFKNLAIAPVSSLKGIAGLPESIGEEMEAARSGKPVDFANLAAYLAGLWYGTRAITGKLESKIAAQEAEFSASSLGFLNKTISSIPATFAAVSGYSILMNGILTGDYAKAVVANNQRIDTVIEGAAQLALIYQVTSSAWSGVKNSLKGGRLATWVKEHPYLLGAGQMTAGAGLYHLGDPDTEFFKGSPITKNILANAGLYLLGGGFSRIIGGIKQAQPVSNFLNSKSKPSEAKGFQKVWVSPYIYMAAGAGMLYAGYKLRDAHANIAAALDLAGVVAAGGGLLKFFGFRDISKMPVKAGLGLLESAGMGARLMAIDRAVINPGLMLLSGLTGNRNDLEGYLAGKDKMRSARLDMQVFAKEWRIWLAAGIFGTLGKGIYKKAKEGFARQIPESLKAQFKAHWENQYKNKYSNAYNWAREYMPDFNMAAGLGNVALGTARNIVNTTIVVTSLFGVLEGLGALTYKYLIPAFIPDEVLKVRDFSRAQEWAKAKEAADMIADPIDRERAYTYLDEALNAVTKGAYGRVTRLSVEGEEDKVLINNRSITQDMYRTAMQNTLGMAWNPSLVYFKGKDGEMRLAEMSARKYLDRDLALEGSFANIFANLLDYSTWVAGRALMAGFFQVVEPKYDENTRQLLNPAQAGMFQHEAEGQGAFSSPFNVLNYSNKDTMAFGLALSFLHQPMGIFFKNINAFNFGRWFRAYGEAMDDVVNIKFGSSRASNRVSSMLINGSFEEVVIEQINQVPISIVLSMVPDSVLTTNMRAQLSEWFQEFTTPAGGARHFNPGQRLLNEVAGRGPVTLKVTDPYGRAMNITVNVPAANIQSAPADGAALAAGSAPQLTGLECLVGLPEGTRIEILSGQFLDRGRRVTYTLEVKDAESWNRSLQVFQQAQVYQGRPEAELSGIIRMVGSELEAGSSSGQSVGQARTIQMEAAAFVLLGSMDPGTLARLSSGQDVEVAGGILNIHNPFIESALVSYLNMNKGVLGQARSRAAEA
ncbi:MAG: hypothetical protein WC541_03095, partial [Dehalococcoidia bacterium]